MFSQARLYAGDGTAAAAQAHVEPGNLRTLDTGLFDAFKQALTSPPIHRLNRDHTNSTTWRLSVAFR